MDIKNSIVSQELRDTIKEVNRRRSVTDGSKLKIIGMIKSGAVKLEDYLDMHNQAYIIAFKNTFSQS